MRNNNSARTFIAALAMAMLLASCGSDDDDDQPSPGNPQEPPVAEQPELRCAP